MEPGIGRGGNRAIGCRGMALRQSAIASGGDEIMDMTQQRSRRRLLTMAGAVWLAAMLPATPIAAQSGEGYLFRTPAGGLTLRVGGMAPLGRSDVFDFTSEQLTLNRRNLAGAAWGGDINGAINDRWEWLVSADWLSRSAPSEYRRFEEQLPNGQRSPITQTTAFRRLPITFGLRYNLTPGGERIGQYAWMPARMVPYVMAGAGGTWYKFRQQGDFVDFANGNRIFTDDYESSGWGATGFVGAGLDISLGMYFALSTQLRASVGNTSMGREFRGFQPIDLSGAMLTTGLRLRFP